MARLNSEQRLGIMYTVASSFFLGWAPILGKLAYAGHVTPYTLVAFRTLVATLLLWVTSLLFWRREIVISWRNLLACIGIGVFNGFGSLLYYTSLVHLDASRASLLNTLYPLWVVLFLFAAGQPLTRLTLARLALSMLGLYLLTRAAPGELDWLGVTLMIASAATYGWHLVLGQWLLVDVPARTAALYILTTMACVVGVARVLQAQPVEPIILTSWVAILALGLTTALSRLTMFNALERLGGIETSLAGLLELLVSLGLAFLLLGERLTAVQWVGGGLLIVSLVLMVRDPGIRLAEGNVPLEWRKKR
ncbi:MAG: DMT family transporter [Chloroflexi bacterium]|jgi:drug/metabolite transporter (DMT)-like permease|nr:DMT family transporter [Chloroflexota bacterium]